MEYMASLSGVVLTGSADVDVTARERALERENLMSILRGWIPSVIRRDVEMVCGYASFRLVVSMSSYM
jgi:hypothetical protein